MKSIQFTQLLVALGMMLLFPPNHGSAQESERRMSWDESIKGEVSGDLDAAFNAVQDFLKYNGDRYLGNQRAGWLLYLKRDYEKAGQFYAKAQKASPAAVSPILGSANCLLASKQMPAAAKAYADALKKDPNNYTANIRLAGINYDAKAYRVAATYFHRLESIYPEDPVPASGLAWCLYFQGQRQQAAPLFQRVLTLNSQYPNAAEGLNLSLAGPEPKGK